MQGGKLSVSYFQELKVFEDDFMNRICDCICSEAYNITDEQLMICGSVAKVLAGQLPDDYRPKDLDMILSKWGFRKLQQHLNQIEGVLMVEKLPHKIILYLENYICVEIWFINNQNKGMSKCYYKHKIPYLYGYKI